MTSAILPLILKFQYGPIGLAVIEEQTNEHNKLPEDYRDFLDLHVQHMQFPV